MSRILCWKKTVSCRLALRVPCIAALSLQYLFSHLLEGGTKIPFLVPACMKRRGCLTEVLQSMSGDALLIRDRMKNVTRVKAYMSSQRCSALNCPTQSLDLTKSPRHSFTQTLSYAMSSWHFQKFSRMHQVESSCEALSLTFSNSDSGIFP